MIFNIYIYIHPLFQVYIYQSQLLGCSRTRFLRKRSRIECTYTLQRHLGAKTNYLVCGFNSRYLNTMFDRYLNRKTKISTTSILNRYNCDKMYIDVRGIQLARCFLEILLTWTVNYGIKRVHWQSIVPAADIFKSLLNN